MAGVASMSLRLPPPMIIMQEYIPYSFENTKSVYYDNRPLLSYGMQINIVIGARSIGKSYCFKRYGIKRQLYGKGEFAFLRDNDSAREKLVMNGGDKFFADVKREFKGKFNGSIKGDTIYINGKTAGYIMASSVFQNYKGNSFENVTTIIYDEFIQEKGRARNQYQGYEFINMLFTIARTRKNVKIILLANALDRGNEILDLLGIKINQGFGFYLNREKSVICHYCDNNPEFNKMRDESVVGKLIKGTVYEDNLFNNQFVDDDSEFFEKRPEKLRLYVIIHNQYNSARVYIAPDGFFYVTGDFNLETHQGVRYVNNIEDVNTRLSLCPKYVLDVLTNGYNKSRFKFENANLKKIFVNFIKKY